MTCVRNDYGYHYICDICGSNYRASAEAIDCEKVPVTYDRGVKVGDTVKMLKGRWKGIEALVKEVIIGGAHWNGVAGKFQHTVILNVLAPDAIEDWERISLVHTSYEVLTDFKIETNPNLNLIRNVKV